MLHSQKTYFGWVSNLIEMNATPSWTFSAWFNPSGKTRWKMHLCHLLFLMTPMNMSSSIDKIQAAIYIDWMKIQSSPCQGVKGSCVLMKMLMWVGHYCVSVFHHVKTFWQSFVLGFFCNVMITTTAVRLRCTRSFSPSSGLVLHCVNETGLKYQAQFLTCTCAGFPLLVTNTWRYHKRWNKTTIWACAFFFLLYKMVTTCSVFFPRQSVKANLGSLCARHVNC